MNIPLMNLTACGLAAFMVASCSKIDESAGSSWADGSEGIPAEYGRFVAVTPVPDRNFEAVLWFEKSDQTIVGARINVSSGEIGPLVLSFPRSK